MKQSHNRKALSTGQNKKANHNLEFPLKDTAKLQDKTFLQDIMYLAVYSTELLGEGSASRFSLSA